MANTMTRGDAYVTMDSFGSDLPENWEEIAEELNAVIDALTEDEFGALDRDEVATVWESYWRGCDEKIVYIARCDHDEGDSFDTAVTYDEEEALNAAYRDWAHLTKWERKHNSVYVIASRVKTYGVLPAKTAYDLAFDRDDYVDTPYYHEEVDD